MSVTTTGAGLRGLSGCQLESVDPRLAERFSRWPAAPVSRWATRSAMLVGLARLAGDAGRLLLLDAGVLMGVADCVAARRPGLAEQSPVRPG